MRCPATAPGSGAAIGTLADVQCDREEGHDRIALPNGQAADHGNDTAALWWDDRREPDWQGWRQPGARITPSGEKVAAAVHALAGAATTMTVAIRNLQRAIAEAGVCPTCQTPGRRETVGMVCQTCGTDYSTDPPTLA